MIQIKKPLLILMAILTLTALAHADGAAVPAPIPDEKSSEKPSEKSLKAQPAVVEATAAAGDTGAVSAAGDTGAVSAACDARLKDYVIHGSLTSTKIGARTWSLSRLSKAAVKSSDSCAKTLLDRAIKEETAYWDHIRDKFKCADDTGKLKASKTCSDHLLSQVKLNISWLKLFKFADAEEKAPKTEAAACDQKCAKAGAESEPLSSGNLENLRTAVHATTMALPDSAHATATEPEKTADEGSLTPSQQAYYEQFMKDKKNGPVLAAQLEQAFDDEKIKQEALAKTQTGAALAATQKLVREAKQHLLDVQTALNKFSAATKGTN